MRVSLEWLRVFVDLPSVGELCDHLRRAGIEVESIDDPAGRAKGVVIGEVLTHGPHPNADKLSVCTVTDGSETHAVVCGAPNVAAGQKIVLARVGASLAGGSFAIGAREVRGVQSRGMICSRAELGLEAKSAGIWVLPADAPLGKDPFTALGIEPALELSITPNRPDLLSHLGVAREIAAATGQRLRYGDWRLSEKGPPVQTLARVKIADSAGCPRYVARVIQGIEVGPSPAWLRERLERVGQRSVNNVVDATNYVLFELGQPLHAFDISRLAAESNLPTIHVRRAAAGEKLTTLDDVERALDPHDLVIADPARVLALAGVMGGAESEVGAGTKAVLLESASFDPVTVRRTAKRHGLSTEASRRFERGVDPGMTMRAADRCAQLIAEIAGGQVAKGVVEVAAKVPPAPEIALRHERVERLLGVDLLPEKVVELLEPLEIRCVRRNDMVLHFQPPTFRRDLEREVDLIEEVARRHGYDAIPERLPDAGGDYVYREAPARANLTARNALLAVGLSEVCTFGFGSPAAYAPFAGREGEPMRVMNPLGEELSALRTTLLPGLFTVARRNQRYGNADVRIFEIGTTFHPRQSALVGGRAALSSQGEDAREQGLPREDLRVGILETGGRFDGRWFEAGQKVDFTDLRGAVEALVETFAPKDDLRFEAAPFEGMSPYASAAVFLGEAPLGYAAQLHPARAAELELEGAVFVAELDLGLLRDAEVRRVQHRSLPKFPGTRRDVAVIADRSVAAQAIISYLRANAGGALGPGVVEDVRVFDVYRGKPIPDDKVSLAFAIDYRSAERTLTDDEVGAAFEGVLAGLKTDLGVEIR